MTDRRGVGWSLILIAVVAGCGRSAPVPASAPATEKPAAAEPQPVSPLPAPLPVAEEPAHIEGALADPNRILLGVVRADNVLTPIAVYSHGRWQGPADEQMAAEEGLPRPATSRAWFASGRPPALEWFSPSGASGKITLTSATPAPTENHCQKNWVLAVEGKGEPLKPNEHHRNLGIATTSDLKSAGLDVLPNDGVESRRVAGWLRSTIDAAEDAYRPTINERADISKPTRNATSMKPRWLGRVMMDGRTLWHAEVVKHYPDKAPSGNDCDTVSVLRLWFVEDEHGQFTALNGDYLRTDCDAKDDLLVTPTGLLPVRTVTGGGC